MAWGIPVRISNLRKRLSKKGATWPYSQIEFIDFLHHAIPSMPDNIQADMRRYYIEGDTQRINPDTGKPFVEDSLFYQNLQEGTNHLYTLIQQGKSGKAYRIIEKRLRDA